MPHRAANLRARVHSHEDVQRRQLDRCDARRNIAHSPKRPLARPALVHPGLTNVALILRGGGKEHLDALAECSEARIFVFLRKFSDRTE